MVSCLSIANTDFLASRYSLSSADPGAPGQRGEVRNEGTISAPGGTVVLAGPTVTNTGTIVANGGRVGMVAANAVSVDVEGDGVLFFQTSATEAKNRLQQLGRIQADGGSIEMRAAARGAFADTVLNMSGVVQAKTIGSREGRIVIDGGGEGIVAVAGKIDATGLAAGEHGGSVTVEGQRVLLDNGSAIDASGSGGGGSIRVGGDFHGANPEIHNAEATVVTGTGAGVARSDAVDQGQGGTVAIWSNGLTRYEGSVSARGGERGGDGGFVEVSGKQSLMYEGKVDTRASKGATGTLLLDPTDVVIDETQTDSATLVNGSGTFTDPTTSPSTIKASTLTGQLATTAVIVDTTSASLGAGTITIKSDVIWTNPNSLTFKALSNLTLNAGVQLRQYRLREPEPASRRRGPAERLGLARHRQPARIQLRRRHHRRHRRRIVHDRCGRHHHDGRWQRQHPHDRQHVARGSRGHERHEWRDSQQCRRRDHNDGRRPPDQHRHPNRQRRGRQRDRRRRGRR